MFTSMQKTTTKQTNRQTAKIFKMQFRLSYATTNKHKNYYCNAIDDDYDDDNDDDDNYYSKMMMMVTMMGVWIGISEPNNVH